MGIERIRTKDGEKFRARYAGESGPVTSDRDQAERDLIVMKKLHAKGELKKPPAPQRETFADFYENVFLRELRAAKKASAEHYGRSWRNYLVTQPWAARLLEKNYDARPAIQTYLQGLLNDGLKPNTVHAIRTALSAGLSRAVATFRLPANPMHGLELVLPPDAGELSIGENYFVTDEQLAMVHAPDDVIPPEWKFPSVISMIEGLRAGETVSMPAENLRQALVTGELRVDFGGWNRDGSRKPPKYGKRRSVPLVFVARDAIERWLEYLPRYCPKNPLDLAFPQPNGKWRNKNVPIGETGGENAFFEMLRRLKIKPGARTLEWHSLRHTAGASLVSGWWRDHAEGELWNMKRVSVFLGHGSETITERYYGHLAPSALTESARKLTGRALLEGGFSQVARGVATATPAPANRLKSVGFSPPDASASR